MKNHTLLIAISLFGIARSIGAAQPERVDFARDVQPILARSCNSCHGPDKQQGGLRFDSAAGALAESDSGAAAIMPGHADQSEMIRRIEISSAELRMPANGEPLRSDEIAVLRNWINQGAAWPDSETPVAPSRREMVVTDGDRAHWAYRPLQAIDPPLSSDVAWCRTPIDQFVLAALRSNGLSPNPLADRRTLIRRVYFDLIGLPPTPEEVEAFVADQDPDAYERLVDRLLASHHYGERWGRHWLDVARYADSDGMETDRDRPNAYPYRDFVIRSLNEDLSYQTFVRWQLAGDEYEPDNPRALAATGFLTAGPTERLMVPMEEERLRLRFNELDDMAVTTMSAFLGLTVGCARCHDHKFDAIPTRDYYRIQCAFTTTARDNVLLTTRREAEAFRARVREWEQERQAAQSKVEEWFAAQKPLLTDKLRVENIAKLPIDESAQQQLLNKPTSEAGLALSKEYAEQLQLSDDDYRAAFSDSQRQSEAALREVLRKLESEKPVSPPDALAIIDEAAEPAPTWLLERGDFYAKREPLTLGFLTVLTRQTTPDEYWDRARNAMPTQGSTGQRRALAEWLTDVDQGAGALLARVMVNRVWQHHFGEGLVSTVSDFGVRSEAPTHPELFEWLASDFVTGGWRLKRLHRAIVTSAVYMQSADFDAKRAEQDPSNRLLWRKRPLRLDAEVLRDAVLDVSGVLNPEPFGPAFKPPIPAEAMLARNAKDPYPTDARDAPETRRRTVYMFHKRVVQHPLMQAFDAPDSTVSCSRRSNTTVAPQALALLNDPFFRLRATDFAARLLAESEEPEHCVKRSYWLALSRPPSDVEFQTCVTFLREREAQYALREADAPIPLRQRALTDFCQALFSLNEFIYVD